MAKTSVNNDYGAKDIDVLEGLEPVRKRPGMYIGGTDATALHHMAAEILDNCIDEAVAHHASDIWVRLEEDYSLTITDNGRGIPVDPHPKYPEKSALEVIMTMLHSGGKFSGKNYETSGGLHGVGISVVNALSDRMKVTVKKMGRTWSQDYSKGLPISKLVKGEKTDETGTSVNFHPDPEIFGDLLFSPKRLYNMCNQKAYLVGNVTIHFETMVDDEDCPNQADLHYEGGISDALAISIGSTPDIASPIWNGSAKLDDGGRIEWAVAWLFSGKTSLTSFCNTIPTHMGGTHVLGFRSALVKSLRQWGEVTKNPKAKDIETTDVDDAIQAIVSCYIRDPQFQGQTKDKLTSSNVQKWVETSIRDRFDHYLAEDPKRAASILDLVISISDARKASILDDSKTNKAKKRQKLPAKLSDCSTSDRSKAELFLVEGDSAGGSAKQARNRETQAILPLKGKILNVASASQAKMAGNSELKDIVDALGCGSGRSFDITKLRYDKIIIMTDADVDGAHIFCLLATYFYHQMPGLLRTLKIYAAKPPLYKVTVGDKSTYAVNEADRDRAIKEAQRKGKKYEISRFKGLGEMPPASLKETTMNPATRTLVQIKIKEDGERSAAECVETLMGNNPATRYKFITDNAEFAMDIDV